MKWGKEKEYVQYQSKVIISSNSVVGFIKILKHVSIKMTHVGDWSEILLELLDFFVSIAMWFDVVKIVIEEFIGFL